MNKKSILRKRSIFIALGLALTFFVIGMLIRLGRYIYMSQSSHSYDSTSILRVISKVNEIDWHPDEVKVAIAGYPEIYVYSFEDKSSQTIYSEVGGISPHVAWSPNGNWLGISERKLWIWNYYTQELHQLEHTYPGDRVYSTISWSPNSEHFASQFIPFAIGRDTEIVICNTSSLLCEGNTSESLTNVTLSDWSPDGQFLAVVEATTPALQIVDAYTGQKEKTLSPATTPATWSPSGKYLIAQGKCQQVIVWDMSTGQRIKTIREFSTKIYDIKWHPSENYVAIAAQNGVRIWNIETGNFYFLQRGLAKSLDWNIDGTKLLTIIENSKDLPEYVMYLWHIDELP